MSYKSTNLVIGETVAEFANHSDAETYNAIAGADAVCRSKWPLKYTKEIETMKAQKAALFLALASGVAFAERGAEELVPVAATSSATGQNSFGQLDRDDDGRISREEVRAGTLPDIFLFMDRNHDGAISLQEFYYRPH